MIKFVKNENYYWATKNDEVIATIYIHYNFFSRKYYYVADNKNFDRVNDAKRYIRENY